MSSLRKIFPLGKMSSPSEIFSLSERCPLACSISDNS